MIEAMVVTAIVEPVGDGYDGGHGSDGGDGSDGGSQ